MDSIIVGKVCPKCTLWKPRVDFNTRRGNQLASYCRPCNSLVCNGARTRR